MRTVFFGTPTIASEVMKRLHDSGVNIIAAVSKPDKPKGRSRALLPTPVKEQALLLGIPLFQPEKASSAEFIQALDALKPDMIIVVAYGEIVKQAILDIPRFGCINLHASLLPEYRGAAPMQRALIDGKAETGVTIMHMVKKMDAGDMIRQAIIPVPIDMTLEDLTERVTLEGSSLLVEVINEYMSGNVPKSTPQDEEKVTFAPKVELEECRLDFSKSALELHNLVRGVTPEPGAYFIARIRDVETMVKLYRTLPLEGDEEPGILKVLEKKRLVITCKKGMLEILELQTSGKKRLSAKDWILGMPKEGLNLVL